MVLPEGATSSACIENGIFLLPRSLTEIWRCWRVDFNKVEKDKPQDESTGGVDRARVYIRNTLIMF